jgi:glycosyltransferase involved in cell wall biosynthesis
MRVLMVETGGRGGLYSYTDDLCRSLCEIGADVTVLTNSLWPDLPRPFKIERHLFEITVPEKKWSKLHWAFDRFWRTFGNSLRRNRFAEKNNFDIAHIQIGLPLIDQFFLKPLARHLPVVLTVHDVQPHSQHFYTRHIILKRYFNIPDRLIVHYERGKKQLVENYGICADRINVICHGMRSLCNPAVPSDARKKLNLPLERDILLFFGTIRADKGLDILLRALQILRTHNPRILLVIAGPVPREVSFETYSNMIEKHNLSAYVQTFIRFISDDAVDYFFAASDIVVLPYLRFESQSGVLLRAYAHKKPVVVSNVGAIGESVHADKIGLVVEPGNPQSLAEAIASVSNNIEKFRSRYNPELECKYSWKQVAVQTMRTYESAIKKQQF